MIEIKGVSKRFGDVRALTDVNAQIPDGSIYGLIGSNGSGKSTLLRTLCGVYKPDGGEILVDGEPVYESPETKKKLFYISDDQYFVPGYNIDDTAKFLSTVYESFDSERYGKLLETFKMDGKRKINTFSKGMKKQACIILGLSCKTKYLLCDETFDGLDPVMRQLTKKLFAQCVADKEMTPIVASHNLRELEDICDRVGLLHKGGILFASDIDEMKLGSHKVQCVFDGELSIKDFESLELTSFDKRGSLYTFIAKGDRETVEEKVAAMMPRFYEILPMTLEEVFICRMEESGYEFDKELI
jgi:ABC-2 type transport system ATP-binding protein